VLCCAMLGREVYRRMGCFGVGLRKEVLYRLRGTRPACMVFRPGKAIRGWIRDVVFLSVGEGGNWGRWMFDGEAGERGSIEMM
jgi:hypothetical protein